ncbi:hypothetical protein LWI28_001913 [Acer negundo]|uniref:Cation/H+ exchanger domain-containing protein n=1 Tax=Acer negundo TaxID=4023 RepID=A0AAD5ICR4_ACENE|nr:hypothetical protein LWI28_001913 [Acer negundo]
MSTDTGDYETRVCFTMPPKTQSSGLERDIFRNKTDEATANYSWYDFSLPRLELHVALMFAVTQIFHFSLKRYGVPLFTSQLIAGLIFSEAILGEEISTKLMTKDSIQVLGAIGTFGYSFFLFLIGVKTDPAMITRASKRASFVGVLSVLAPLLCILPIIPLSQFEGIDKISEVDTLFILPCYALTAFPVITVLLSDMKILNSELGRICHSSALTGDIFSMFILVASGMLKYLLLIDKANSLIFIGSAIAFFAIVLLVLRPAMSMVVRYTPEGKPVSQTFVYLIIIAFLACVSLINRWHRVFSLLAPYVLGLAVPHGPPLGSHLVDKFDSMIQNLFVPLFVTGCAMRVKSINIFKDSLIMVNSAIAIVALLVKFLVCFLPQLYSKMPMKDALALALIMCSKGIVELAAFAFLIDVKLIDQNVFGFMFFVITFMASFVPLAVKCLYDPSRKYAGYNKRNVMGLRPNSELPIVAVIHVPDNVGSIINLLDVSCPTKDNPMTVDVLHLIKLSGQAAPIFISHQKKRNLISCNSYSQNLIISFNKFQGNNWGAVSVNFYTAVSPPNLMHDDICTLALDKLASLVILPFHRRWYMNGSIESNCNHIRTLNARVLEKAPCSVGILVDRGNMRRAMMPSDSSSSHDHDDLPSYNVALVFLGGNDDREALTFAKRMVQDTRISLTVLHLTANDNNQPSANKHWDDMRDSEVLRDVKTNGYINYMHKEVADGHETTMIIRSMVNNFKLIIVGRRDKLESQQTSGLIGWSEFPELGVLGDLFASVDYSGRCSVLVVQQQETVVGI